MNVTAVLYDGFETLDMFGPVEMLGSSGEFEVGFFSLEDGVVTGKHGVPVLASPLADVVDPGVLLLPGGFIDRELENGELMKLVDGAHHIDEARRLIREYTEWFGRDLAFQGLDDELAHVGDKYLPPEGRLVVALGDDGAACGCVAYHRLDGVTAEMKRLYVTPARRGQHLGERLARRIMELAREDGCARMVLDTVAPLETAIALYRKLGFEEIEPYYHNPFPDVIYFGIDL